jgi:hypothetical protein
LNHKICIVLCLWKLTSRHQALTRVHVCAPLPCPSPTRHRPISPPPRAGVPAHRAPSEAEPELVRDTVTTAAAGACLGAVVGAAESAWKLNRGPAPLTDAARLMGSHAALLGTIGAVFAATEVRPVNTPPGRVRPASALGCV